MHARRIGPRRRVSAHVTPFVLAGLVLSGCTSADPPPPPAPLPADRAAPAADICAQLLPPQVQVVLGSAGVRPDGTVAPVAIPLTPPGGSGQTATEGCELRLAASPLEGVVVRRVLDGKAISQLRDGVEPRTDKLPGASRGWAVRWSDAASTAFVLPEDGAVQEAYIVQLVLQHAGLNRRDTVSRLVTAVLSNVASSR